MKTTRVLHVSLYQWETGSVEAHLYTDDDQTLVRTPLSPAGRPGEWERYKHGLRDAVETALSTIEERVPF
jgi:hypothetical protein